MNIFFIGLIILIAMQIVYLLIAFPNKKNSMERYNKFTYIEHCMVIDVFLVLAASSILG